MKYFRRSLLSLLLLPSLLLGNATLASATESKVVSQSEAETTAQYYQQLFTGVYFSSWAGANLLGPVVFQSINHEPIAYEFTVEKEGKSLGFILTSATKELPPLLECSDGAAPSSYLTQVKNQAVVEGLCSAASDQTLLYWGACTYSVQFGNSMKNSGIAINLPTGQTMNVPNRVSFQFSTAETASTWAEIAASNQCSNQDSLLYTNYDISGVPAYVDGDTGGYPYTSWPACAGSYDDPWDTWDGCTPIAGSMVHGYWRSQGYSNLPSDADVLIDDNHHFMMTGDTSPSYTNPYNMDDGLSGVFNRYGYYGFSCSNLYTPSWQTIKDEVNANRPSILTMQHNSTYGDHSVTLVGWYENGSTLTVHVHNTWDTSVHVISWGDWWLYWLGVARP